MSVFYASIDNLSCHLKDQLTSAPTCWKEESWGKNDGLSLLQVTVIQLVVALPFHLHLTFSDGSTCESFLVVCSTFMVLSADHNDGLFCRGVRKIAKKRLLASLRLSAFRMEQHDSHCTEYY